MKSRKAEGPRLRLSIEEVDMIRELRAKKIDNLNENSALTDHLNERGIDKNDVISVKHWQSANGEYRFSIVTKANIGIKEKDIFVKVTKLVENYSSDYQRIKRKRKVVHHLLVINHYNIYIGKYGRSIENGEDNNS